MLLQRKIELKIISSPNNGYSEDTEKVTIFNILQNKLRNLDSFISEPGELDDKLTFNSDFADLIIAISEVDNEEIQVFNEVNRLFKKKPEISKEYFKEYNQIIENSEFNNKDAEDLSFHRFKERNEGIHFLKYRTFDFMQVVYNSQNILNRIEQNLTIADSPFINKVLGLLKDSSSLADGFQLIKDDPKLLLEAKYYKYLQTFRFSYNLKRHKEFKKIREQMIENDIELDYEAEKLINEHLKKNNSLTLKDTSLTPISFDDYFSTLATNQDIKISGTFNFNNLFFNFSNLNYVPEIYTRQLEIFYKKLPLNNSYNKISFECEIPQGSSPEKILKLIESSF